MRAHTQIFRKAALARCGLLFAGLIALAACQPPFEEPFFQPYDKVSGPAGTIYFVTSTRMRACTWFECGESSFKYLGAAVEAMGLRAAPDGTLALTSLARIECPQDRLGDCDTTIFHAQLRRGPDGPVVGNSPRGIDADTLAWQQMRDVALGEGMWLCTAAALPASEGADVLKIAPTADFSRAAQVLYALHRAPQGEDIARCASTRSLPRPDGAPANLYLADALRDPRGRLQIVYLAKEHAMAFDHIVTLLAVQDAAAPNGWRMEQVDEAARGPQPSPLYMPGFLDNSAHAVVLDAAYGYGGAHAAEFRVFDRASGKARSASLRIPAAD